MPYLDSILATIEAEHGRNSPAYASALAQVIILLARPEKRFDLIQPYSEAAIGISRRVYGTDHRETAVALHTHADVLSRQDRDNYAEAAIPLLREAAEIRRRVLGTDHEDTLSAEGNLARLLLEKWHRSAKREQEMQLLDEAQKLAEHFAAVHGKSQDLMGFSRVNGQDLLGRIAFARGDYEKAVGHFRTAFDGGNPLSRMFSCSASEKACREYAEALHKLGRDDEAKKVEERLND